MIVEVGVGIREISTISYYERSDDLYGSSTPCRRDTFFRISPPDHNNSSLVLSFLSPTSQIRRAEITTFCMQYEKSEDR